MRLFAGQGDKKEDTPTGCILFIPFCCRRCGQLLAVVFAADREFSAALLAACGEHAATVLRLHTLTETMLVDALAVVGLECTFHVLFLFLSDY